MQQAKILLEKINALQRSISLNKGTIAPIERDLMLSYIRQLYEIFLDLEESSTPKQQPAVKTEAVKTVYRPQEVEPTRPTYTPPKVDTPPSTAKEEPTIIREVAPLPPIIPIQQPVYEPTPPPPPASQPIPRSTSSGNNKINALFDFRQSSDLSERLSERPITDLTKAFAINDRLLYINELFGKDGDSFNESLKLLNKFERIEEAKSLLVSLAEQYDWTREDRAETAQSFVKTVRRRYI